MLDVQIDLLGWHDATDRICYWASQRWSRYVSICDSHSVVTASRDKTHGRHIAAADMVTADGWPVAWMLRRTADRRQDRINGPDLMGHVLLAAEAQGLSVYVYGCTEATLAALAVKLQAAFPRLRVAGMHSPPFRPLSEQEDQADVERINASGAHIVLTGLGCPKEDRWMFEHRGRVAAVMLGIGAGIEFWAGTVPRAPKWMRENGFEWLFRLWQEPRRLWRRYLVHNSLFVIGAARQLARHAWLRVAGQPAE